MPSRFNNTYTGELYDAIIDISSQDNDIFIIKTINKSEINPTQDKEPEIKILREYKPNKAQGIKKIKHQKPPTFSYIDHLKEKYWKLHDFNRYYRNSDIESKTNNEYTESNGMLRLNYRNIGYRMLIKTGWYPGIGLGINNQGIKYPITVQTQTNKLGLGIKL